MGQTPAKFFPQPTPYGTSPAGGVLSQAQAAARAPQQNFLPLTPSAPPTSTAPAQQSQGQPGMLGIGGGFGLNRFRNTNTFGGYGGPTPFYG